MPLWLVRLAGMAMAMFMLAQGASALIGTGMLGAAVTAVNPDEPRRQLERSLSLALAASRAKIVLVGSTPFVETMLRSCRFKDRVITVPIDGPLWPDYETAIRHLTTLRPSVVIFQARPYLWTNMRPEWGRQRVTLMARGILYRQLFPIRDVRTVIAALREMAERPSAWPLAGFGIASFHGALFDSQRVEEALARISSRLATRSGATKALFVLDPDEIPANALPETRERILTAFSEAAGPNLQLETIDRTATRFQCDREAFRPIADAMRQPRVPPASSTAPALES